MVKRKKWFVPVLILIILAFAAGGVIYLISGGSFSSGGKQPSGTWSVKESFPGSPVSDFTVTVQNLKSATHFELRIDGFPIGERVPIDDYVRGLPIIFSKPERMEVWFFDCEDADEPIAIARCHHSGALVFPGTEGAFDENNAAANVSNGDSDNDNNGVQNEEEEDEKGLLNNLKQWLDRTINRLFPKPDQEKPEKEITNGEEEVGNTAPPVGGGSDDDNSAESGSTGDNSTGDSSNEGNEESGSAEKDPPAAAPAGRWYVEPDTPPTALFKISVDNIDPGAYYELYASGILVGKRVPLGEGVCSISLMFSEPSALKVKFFAGKNSASLLAEAECTEDGELKFIE
jgi:hypothetical protein